MKMAFVIFHIFITAYKKLSASGPCYIDRVESIELRPSKYPWC